MFGRRSVLGLVLICALSVACDGAPEEVPTEEAADAVVASEQSAMTEAQIRERRADLHGEVVEFAEQLGAEGRYDCCTKTPCTWCALNTGGCSCGEGLRRGEPVCEQCAYLWRRGQGDEPGVDPASVESFLEAERKLNQSTEPPAEPKPEAKACVCGHGQEGTTKP